MNKTILRVSLWAVIGLAACNTKKEEKAEIGKYQITNPVLLDTSFKKEYVAQIQSLQNVEIHAMVKGYIQSINVDEGQQVHTGQLLFKIMPKEYEADLQKAKAEATTADIEYQNLKKLAEKNIVSSAELAIAKAKLDEAKAEAARAELFVSFTEIKAPFDGIIDRIKFKVGSLIDEGTLLTSLSNNKDIYAYFNVSEVDYLDYKAKNKGNTKEAATLILANSDEFRYKGSIETIEGEFDSETGNIAFRAKFPNPDLLLKHGETAKISMRVPLKNALIIPQKSTYELQDKIYVYVVDDKNVVKTKSITIKQKLSNIYVVESGLSANDKILVEGGVQGLNEDDKIETEFVSPQSVLEHLQLLKH